MAIRMDRFEIVVYNFHKNTDHIQTVETIVIINSNDLAAWSKLNHLGSLFFTLHFWQCGKSDGRG